jgi:hypothetical protein
LADTDGTHRSALFVQWVYMPTPKAGLIGAGLQE